MRAAPVSVVAVSTFLALLALMLAAGTIAVLVLALAGRWSASARRPVDSLRGWLSPIALRAAWLVAATAMAGSLYFSEVAGFVPCALCWYQRIAMYPLAVLLLVAALRRDFGFRPYALTLAALGSVISAYHVLVQRLPGLPSGSCSVDAPCSAIYVERFGFVTIPVMALIGFLAIITILAVVARPLEDEKMAA
jgi:disulfide bond formation protein DsbB